MIDLETALRPLVDTAPGAPPVDDLPVRDRPARRRSLLGAVAVVTVAAILGAALLADRDGGGDPVTIGGASVTTTVTLLDGQRLELEHPEAMRLGAPVLAGALLHDDLPNGGAPVVVTPAGAPVEDGYERFGTYADREVRIFTRDLTAAQRDALWGAVVVADTPTGVSLRPRPPYRLGPIDAPLVDWGPIAVLDGGSPSTCAPEPERDAESGTWWCDAETGLRLHADDPGIDAASVDVRLVDPSSATVPASPLADRVAPFVGTNDGQVVVWGGTEDDAPKVDGAILDPDAGRWRPIPAAPIRDVVAGVDVLLQAAGTMTTDGRLVVVNAMGDAATFEVATGEWRTLAAAPLGDGYRDDTQPWVPYPIHAVTADDRVVVWVSGRTGAIAATLDLATETWQPSAPPIFEPRRLPTIVWTGHEVVVWGGQRDDNSPWINGAAYDPETDTWRWLPDPPVADASYFSGFYAHNAAWTGREMVVWGWVHQSLGEDTEGYAYDPERDSWRRIAEAPIDHRESCECVGGNRAVATPDGDVLVWTGNVDRRGAHLLRYDPDTDAWATVGGPFAGAEDFFGVELALPRAGELLVLGPDLRVDLAVRP